MIFAGKAEVIEEYSEIVGVIRADRANEFKLVARALARRAIPGQDLEIRIPSILRLFRRLGKHKRGVRFTKMNVFLRDEFTCAYCLTPQPIEDLNFDHVFPRVRGGATVWENIVASCFPCNTRKAGRTPEEAGMPLRRPPFKPKFLPLIGPRTDWKAAPPSWLDYCYRFLDVNREIVAA